MDFAILFSLGMLALLFYLIRGFYLELDESLSDIVLLIIRLDNLDKDENIFFSLKM
jgi:hypothetical protein